MTQPVSLKRRCNRTYRRMKVYLLDHRVPVLTWAFFTLSGAADRLLSGRKQTEAERQANAAWKKDYQERWARPGARRLRVTTDHPVAVGSADHRTPRGTIFDNSTNPRFNRRLYELLGSRPDLAFLDLGCAGGGLVRSYLEDGHLAIGLEGSDLSKRHRSGEWDTIPEHLFTADITRDFSITDEQGRPVLFDAVSAWEVFEHIPEAEVGGLIDRIRRCLKPGGYFIGSIDLGPDGNPLTGAVYHLTLRPADWWIRQFESRGFRVLREHPFAPEDMVRGHGRSIKDWHPDDGSAIHVVAQRAN